MVLESCEGSLWDFPVQHATQKSISFLLEMGTLDVTNYNASIYLRISVIDSE